jgi:chromosome segregation ATPase
MIPLKRNPSRSPDGSSNQRKMARGILSDLDRQRNPSVNTNQVNANADPRLLRGSRGNISVQSPISTDGGAYQDASSNRSTPQPQTAVMTTVGGTAGTIDDGDAFKKQLLESLVALTTHITAGASLRSSHELATRRLESATAEHKNMTSFFQKYPAIEERLTDDRDKAAKNAAKLDKQLELSGVSQAKAVAPLCETIWDLFSKAAASSHPDPQRDAVTREEYEGLQERFQKQQDLLDQHQDRIEKQSSQIDELRKTVREDSAKSVQAKIQASNTDRDIIGDITALKTRLDKIETSEQMDKDMLKDLVPMAKNQKDDIQRLASDIAQHKSDLAAKEVTLSGLKSAVDSATSSTYTTRADLGKVERQLTVVKNEVNQIWQDIKETGKQPVIGRLKNHDQFLNNLDTKVRSAESRLGSLSQDLHKHPKDSKESARIKLAEEKIDELAQELSEVKEDARLKASNHAAAIIPAPATNSVPTAPPPNFNFDAFKQEVVDDVEEQTDELAKLMDEHDAQIVKLKEDLGSLSDKHNRLELEHENEVRKRQSMDQAISETRDATNAKCDSIQSDANTLKTTTETLRSDIDSLSTTVRELQNRLAQSSTAVNGTAAAQQFRSLPVHSPQASNPRTSISGPVQTNGIHPPNGAIPPQQMANGTVAGSSNGEVAATPDQIQGIWASIHSLQHRYDNLTTEDIVRAMVDQHSKMYPAPKEFQAAVNMLQNVDKALDNKLTSLETKLGSVETRIGSLAQNSAAVRNEFRTTATENNTHVNGRIQQLQNDLQAARDGIKQLRNEIINTINDATKSFDKAVDVQSDAIIDLRAKVTALANVAFGDNENEQDRQQPSEK